MQKAINEIIEDSQLTIPVFIYYLADYKGVRVATYAPIAVGDSVSVRLDDDTYLSNKKVLGVHHLDEPQDVGKQILTTFITLED